MLVHMFMHICTHTPDYYFISMVGDESLDKPCVCAGFILAFMGLTRVMTIASIVKVKRSFLRGSEHHEASHQY